MVINNIFFPIENLKSSPQIKISDNVSDRNHEIIPLEITQDHPARNEI